MKKFKVLLTVEVSDNWIADGFNLAEPERLEQLKEAVENMLPYAYEHELKVVATVQSQPNIEVLNKLMGY